MSKILGGLIVKQIWQFQIELDFVRLLVLQ
jgi:hypothetical protein